MREKHRLNQPTTATMPENIIFVDTETTQYGIPSEKVYHKLMLGVAIYLRYRSDRDTIQKETFRFETKEEFWLFVKSKVLSKKILYLISHNAVFDFIVMQHIQSLEKLGYKCVFTFEGGMTYISKWRKKNHSIMILDNSNWFKGKLEKWGKELKLPKLNMPSYSSEKEKWFIYCQRDCEILYQLFLWYVNFLRKNNLGSWKYTIASSAFNTYRYRFMLHPIYIPGDDEESKLSRASYHGGRTECFRIGEYNEGLYYKLDVNSMYPAIMRQFGYPTNFDGYYDYPNQQQVHQMLSTHCIIADVQLSVDLPYFVYKKDGRNVYPIGTFRTTLTSNELLLAFDNNWIVKVYSCSVYRKRNIFVEYVDFFYRVKLDAEENEQELLRSFAKLYLNSLYGKFGQRGYVDRVIGTDVIGKLQVSHGFNLQSNQRFVLRQMGTNILYSERGEESYNSFSAIASHVTANARLMLYDLILRARRENCFYCDTDSIIVNQVGFDNLKKLLHKTRLGFLKVEGISDNVTIVAPKHYEFSGKWVIKGIRKTADKLGNNRYSQEVWPGLNTILRSHREVYFNTWVIKQLSPTIRSGEVNNEQFISPFSISDYTSRNSSSSSIR